MSIFNLLNELCECSFTGCPLIRPACFDFVGYSFFACSSFCFIPLSFRDRRSRVRFSKSQFALLILCLNCRQIFRLFRLLVCSVCFRVSRFQQSASSRQESEQLCVLHHLKPFLSYAMTDRRIATIVIFRSFLIGVPKWNACLPTFARRL